MPDRNPLLPGELLNDRYRIDAQLGRGGMSVVYRAHDTVLDREVAVKLLTADRLGREGPARLLREAQAIARLNHPNIVQVHDAGQLDGAPYIVMELVEGPDLHQQPPEELTGVLAIARQISAALEHAHAHGIIHRDLKPENILIAPDGAAKLMDFGLARSMASRITGEGQISGTVFYLAPEIALGQPVDARADLYSLGVMLYELTTGSLPFEDGDPLAVISQHLHVSAVPPRARREDLPPGLNALILRLLSKRPEERPATAGEVAQALARLETGESLEVESAELSLLDRFVRGRLVGRQRELSEARAVWQRAASGESQLLLVSGEPGVGKSRLVRELSTWAQVSGGQALTGACYPKETAPYGPVSQMVRASMRPGEDLGLSEVVLSDLATIAPDLRNRYPDLPIPQPLDPQGEKQRIFESVVAWCTRMADAAPLLLVFEDLHWSDSLSLQLVHHLARRLRQARLLILVTYREVELLDAGPMVDLLHDLNRERLAVRIKLARLDRQATHDLLASMFAEEITPEFLEGIYRETEGNPFFIEEVCKALIDSRKLYFADGRWQRPSMEELEIPQSIRLAVQARVRILPEPTQEALRMASVFGHEFAYPVLELASELDEAQLAAALEVAERAQLIEPGDEDPELAFRFTHVLIPTALYEEIGTLRRRQMHRQVAECIEILHPDDLEALAHHFAEAGNRPKAIDYSHRAALRSRRLHAYDAAQAHLVRALDLLDADEQPEMQIVLLEELADLRRLLGQPAEAISLYREVLDLWGPTKDSDPQHGVRLHRKIVETVNGMVWYADRQRYEPEVRASQREGLNLAEGLPPNPDVVRLQIAVAMGDMTKRTFDEWDQAERFARTAVELAEQLDDLATLSAALDALGTVYGARGRFSERLEVALRRLELSEQPAFADLHEQSRILLEVASAHRLRGGFSQAISFAERQESLSQRIRAIDMEVSALRSQAYSWFRLDRWDKVLEIDDKWRALEPSYGNFYERVGPMCFMIAISAAVHALRGEAERAAALRAESFAIMSGAAGPSEGWGRDHHY